MGLVGVAYQRNELDIALRHVTEGIPLCRQFVYTPPLAFGLAALAWIRQATADPAGALAAMDEAVQVAPVPAGPLNPVPAQRARLLLPQGDVDGAARWTKENGLRAEDDPRYASEPEHLMPARVLLAQGRPGQALTLLDRLIASQRAGHVTEILLACLARLQRAFTAAHPTPGPRSGATAAVPGIVEPLTSRELEVLGMLATGHRGGQPGAAAGPHSLMPSAGQDRPH